MTARVALWLGLSVAALGLVVGLLPVSAAGVDCGSAFQAAGEVAGCVDVRSYVRLAAVPLLVVGGLAAAAGLLVPQLMPEAMTRP